jgi:hypothetical protein
MAHGSEVRAAKRPCPRAPPTSSVAAASARSGDGREDKNGLQPRGLHVPPVQAPRCFALTPGAAFPTITAPTFQLRIAP